MPLLFAGLAEVTCSIVTVEPSAAGQAILPLCQETQIEPEIIQNLSI